MEDREIGGEKVTIAARIDAVGLYCPMPIILLKKELGKASPDQVVEILADDSSFQIDLIAWCNLTTNIVLSVSKNEEDIYIAYVKKNPAYRSRKLWQVADRVDPTYPSDVLQTKITNDFE